MSKSNSIYDTIFQITTDAVSKGIAHLNTQDEQLTSNFIHIEDNKLINFSSCSYLGLEFEEDLKNGAINAILNYGTQFSASRAYVSPKYYLELEEKFGQIFEAHSIVAPTTTLGHIAAIPVLVGDNDAIILDHQVHNSVQTAANLVRHRGVHVEIIRHNNMQMLEDRIKVLRQKHHKIWYMADGIYSMFGDTAPVENINYLMNKYPELYFYVDDAHGMSCFGKHGRGFVLNETPIHEKLIFTTSLAKAFATGGAVLSFSDKKMAHRVRSCGGSFITSGPMQPAALGAAVASANFHLSERITVFQETLHENIKYCNLLIKKAGLPIVAESNSPVFFIAVSLPKIGYDMVNRMMKEGYYMNIGIFPAVPIKNTGIRFTITRLHTFEQIENMIGALAYHLPLAIEEAEFSLGKIYQAFKMPTPEEKQIENQVNSLVASSLLKTEHYKSIDFIDESRWNNLLGDRGTFTKAGLQLLEKSFIQNERPEDNWEFDYLIISDHKGIPVLATFFTTALCKDDMLAASAISKQIEHTRLADPYYLTSKTVMMGSLLTEGEHLYLDQTNQFWKEAVKIFFDKINELQTLYKATMVSLRDFINPNTELEALLVDYGYFKVNMLDTNSLNIDKWQTESEFFETLSPRSKQHHKDDILRHIDKFETKVLTNLDAKNIEKLYHLYLNVKGKSLAINTFTLPYKVFENIATDSNWEILCLFLKNSDKAKDQPIAVFFSFKGNNNYNPLIIGIDYDYQNDFKCYRQVQYQMILRAKYLSKKTIKMGFGAATEKRKFGAIATPTYAYMQAKDNFNLSVIASMNVLETTV
ncbi:MAG: aminotransferase class I/II-fold pyridoxal phosphate-dependent enzyme [Bacteroidota bacterium]|nr:aminotransferase class I/II-fold pyridoxal phosphate-dependent enzyme [Bacteroidota bacterium]